MKYSRTLSFVFVLTLMSVLAFGGNKNNYGTEKKDITLSNAVQVGTQQLNPGDYTLRWNNNGDATNVTFLQNGKEKAQVPARFVQSSTQTNASLETDNSSSTPTLTRVYVKNGVLYFTGTTESNNKAAPGEGSAAAQ